MPVVICALSRYEFHGGQNTAVCLSLSINVVRSMARRKIVCITISALYAYVADVIWVHLPSNFIYTFISYLYRGECTAGRLTARSEFYKIMEIHTIRNGCSKISAAMNKIKFDPEDTCPY